MITNYPEYNNATSRLGCPGLAVVAAFTGRDVLWPADCPSDDIGLSGDGIRRLRRARLPLRRGFSLKSPR